MRSLVLTDTGGTLPSFQSIVSISISIRPLDSIDRRRRDLRPLAWKVRRYRGFPSRSRPLRAFFHENGAKKTSNSVPRRTNVECGGLPPLFSTLRSEDFDRKREQALALQKRRKRFFEPSGIHCRSLTKLSYPNSHWLRFVERISSTLKGRLAQGATLAAVGRADAEQGVADAGEGRSGERNV